MYGQVSQDFAYMGTPPFIYPHSGPTSSRSLLGLRALGLHFLGPALQAAVPHLEAVAGLLSDGDYPVRAAACEALGKHGEALGSCHCKGT